MRLPRDYSDALRIALGLSDLSILDEYDRRDYVSDDRDPRVAACKALGTMMDEQATRLESIEDKLDKLMTHLGVDS